MLDERDLVILNTLKKNAKLSSRALAKVSGLPISTVNRRVRKLEKDGVIKGYTILIDYEKVGKPVEFLAFINIEEVIPGKGHIPIENVKKEINNLENIVEILTVEGGNFDLIVRARATSPKEVTSFIEKIRNIEGIEEVSSVIIT